MFCGQSNQDSLLTAAEDLKLRRVDDLAVTAVFVSTRDKTAVPVGWRGHENVRGDRPRWATESRAAFDRNFDRGKERYEENRPPHRPASAARGPAFFTYLS